MESSTRAIGLHSRRATRRRHPWASRRVPQREIRRRRVRSRPRPPPFLFGQRRHHSMVASNWLNSGVFWGYTREFPGNGDAPFGALAPILRIRLCGPICTTKPSAQSLLFCVLESLDSSGAHGPVILSPPDGGAICLEKSLPCSGRPVRPTTITRTDSTSGWGNNRGKVTSSADDAALSMNMVSVRSVASSPPSVRPPAFRS